jgi:hypothetical protein
MTAVTKSLIFTLETLQSNVDMSTGETWMDVPDKNRMPITVD